VSVLMRTLVFGFGFVVSVLASTCFPGCLDYDGPSPFDWILIATFGFLLPALVLLFSSVDVYRRTRYRDAERPTLDAGNDDDANGSRH
jgi:hypothetical protein